MRWSALRDYFTQGWREALQWKLLAWLSPQEPIRLLTAAGEELTVKFGPGGVAAPSKGAAKLSALELPADLLLRRTISLPNLAPEDLLRVIEQEVVKASPFGLANTVWGYSSTALAGGRWQIEYVVAARDSVQSYLDALQPARAGTQPELWGDRLGQVVFRGFGEARRLRRLTVRRWAVVALLAMALCVLAGILLTPTIQLRYRAIQASQAYELMQRASAPQAKQRDALQAANDRLDVGQSLVAAPFEYAVLLEDLSKLLEDDTWLSEFKLHGNLVQISGETGNSAKLMQALGAVPAYKDVKALGAFSKSGAGKESFSIEFKVGQ